MATAVNQLIGRMMNLFTGTQGLPKITPYKEMGVSGTAIFSGLPMVREKNAQLVGTQKWITFSDLVTNTSIVAAGVRYFLNVVANSTWSMEPADDSAEAKAVAEFIEDVMNDMETPFRRVVRRSSMYRFHGFGVQEWTAKRRKQDKKIGLDDIEIRPAHTIERWQVDDKGTVIGVWQRAPYGGELLYLPREKIVYMVEDSLTDSPDGLGLFRHLIEPYERLRRYMELEGRGFERDLRGIPIGRIPYNAIRAAVDNGKMTKEEATKQIQAIESFVQIQSKQPDTSIVLDSMPYVNQTDSGNIITSTYQYGIELLQGGSQSFVEVGAAIDRCNREMARVLGVEQLLLGEGGGANRALSEDKSRNFYLVVNGTLDEITDSFDKDVVNSICDLNGIKEEMRPKLKHSDIALRSVQEITAALRDMATAGAVMSPNDPAVNDVRDMLGISQAPEMTPEQLGMMTGNYPPQQKDEEGNPIPPKDAGEDGEEDDEAAAERVPPKGKPPGPNPATRKMPMKKFSDGRLSKWDDKPKLSKYNERHDEKGRFDFAPDDVKRFKELKGEWAKINNRLLEYVDNPAGVEVQKLMDRLKVIVKETHSLRADPGGPEGIGMPGGHRDVVIVGAGPGGLSSAIMAGAEGYDTLVIEANKEAGGQSRYSSRIENFPGFPVGVTGEQLAKSMFQQAERLGVESKLGTKVTGLSIDPETGVKTLTLSNGETVTSRSVIIAGGLQFQKLPGLEGDKVIYGDGKELAAVTGKGDALVIGGSNGAAQAALGVARTADHVYLLSRSEISNNMSDYQVEAVRNHSGITVIEGDKLATFEQSGDKLNVTTSKGLKLTVDGLGVFAGSHPDTTWLPESLRGEGSKCPTDKDLQTSMPGVYAVGDVRVGGIGRIGGAVGDGQMAVKNLGSYLPKVPKDKIKKSKSDTEAWNRTVDQLFALDKQYPWFGQTAEQQPLDVVKYNKEHDAQGRFTFADDSSKVNDVQSAKDWIKSAKVTKALAAVVQSPLAKAVVTASISGLVSTAFDYSDGITDDLIHEHVRNISNHMMVSKGVASQVLRQSVEAIKSLHNPKMGAFRTTKMTKANDKLGEALDAILAALDRYDESAAKDPVTKFREDMAKFNENHDEQGRFTFGDGGGSKGSKDITRDMSVTPPTKPKQSTNSLSELYNKAHADEQEYYRTMNEFAKATGGELKLPPMDGEFGEGSALKPMASAQRKMRDEKLQPQELLDVLRATVLYKDIEDSRNAIAKYITDHPKSVVRIKDRHEKPSAGGYRDVLLNVRTPNGTIAELQFNTKNLLEAKNTEGHKLYDQLRTYRGKSQAVRDYLMRKSERLYQSAFLKDGNSDYKRKKT